MTRNIISPFLRMWRWSFPILGIMASSPWLDLLECTAGLDTPFLHEHHGAYGLFNDIPDGHPQIVMLIRGHHTFLMPEAEYSINLKRVGLPLLFAADCGLHLPQRLGVLKAGS